MCRAHLPPKGEALTGLVRLLLQAESAFLCLVGCFGSGTESQQKAKILLLRTNLWLTVSAKSLDSDPQNQLLADRVSKKLRSLLSKQTDSRQSQQKAKILLLRANF